MAIQIEDLLFKTIESDKESDFKEFLHALSGEEIPDKLKSEYLTMLLDAWNSAGKYSIPKARFCIDALNRIPSDSGHARIALENSLRELLSVDMPRSESIRQSGVRENSEPIAAVLRKISIMVNLYPGYLLFLKQSAELVSIVRTDSLTAHLSVRKYPDGNVFLLDLKSALEAHAVFLKDCPAFQLRGAPDAGMTFIAWKEVLRKYSILPLDDKICLDIAKSILVPASMAYDAFSSWIQPREKESDAERSVSDARNIAELNGILNRMKAYDSLEGVDDSVLRNIFTKSCSPMAPLADAKMILETAALLASVLSDEKIKATLAPLKELPVWISPDGIQNAEYFGLWDKIPAKSIKGVLKAASILFTSDYLLEMTPYLPGKFWPIAGAMAGNERISEFAVRKRLTPDGILFAWKNRKKGGYKELISGIDLNICMDALDPKKSPGIIWPAARKELVNMIITNQEFQKHLIQGIEDNPASFLDRLNVSDAFHEEDKKSLIVKIARISEIFKKFTSSEKGRGLAALSSASSQNAPPSSAESNDFKIASHKSFRLKMAELNKIINKDTPENTAAIAHARGYGDLRENAEYSAAKERQRFLNKRRHELESEILSVKTFDLRDIHKFDGHAVPGTSVTISKDGHEETFHILGTWDSDPDRSILSCNSAFAKAVIGKRKGETVLLPEGKEAIIVDVSLLPDSIIHEFNDEQHD